MDTLHASVLDAKLRLLDEWNVERTNIAKIYDDRLKNIEQITLPVKLDNTIPVYYIYPVLVENRENL